MKALILVDLQQDFCLDGALEVEDGDAVVEVANRLMEADIFDLVVATQDWHPQNHGSFASNQGTDPFTVGELNGLPQLWWPDHCVQGSRGAEFHPNLNMNKVATIFRKGMDEEVDSYSGFYDNNQKSTGLGEYLANMNISKLYILGLATDYCVKFTVLDALKFGFNTYLIQDGCRGVNMNPDDSYKAIEEIKKEGVTIVNSGDLLNVIHI